MAGEWIKMRTNLWDDPRVSRIVDLTDQSEAAVIGGLYWLWATADEHTEDGILNGLTVKAIDRKTGVPGLGEALCAVGWLEVCDAGLRITHFEEHNGASAKKRAQTAKRVANSRSGNADVTLHALQDEHESVTGALAREEKIREEVIQTTSNDVVGANPPVSAPPKLAEVKVSIPDCPHQDVLSLWEEVLPHLPQHNPNLWKGARADHLRARWRETAKLKGWATQDQGLAYFKKLFGYVGESQFLTGRITPRDPGRSPFVCELAWLVMPENWAKCLEGKFHQEAA